MTLGGPKNKIHNQRMSQKTYKNKKVYIQLEILGLVIIWIFGLFLFLDFGFRIELENYIFVFRSRQLTSLNNTQKPSEVFPSQISILKIDDSEIQEGGNNLDLI